VRDFGVDIILSIEGALKTEEAGGFVDVIVGVSEDAIVGLVVSSVISSLESELSLFLLSPILVVDDRSVVVGTVMYMPLISSPGETAGRWRSYGAFSVPKYSRMPIQIQLVDR
jgi:hypothetical protein